MVHVYSQELTYMQGITKLKYSMENCVILHFKVDRAYINMHVLQPSQYSSNALALHEGSVWDKLDVCCMVYLHDVLIFSQSPNEYKEHL